jgi:hypothetical protein
MPLYRRKLTFQDVTRFYPLTNDVFRIPDVLKVRMPKLNVCLIVECTYIGSNIYCYLCAVRYWDILV